MYGLVWGERARGGLLPGICIKICPTTAKISGVKSIDYMRNLVQNSSLQAAGVSLALDYAHVKVYKSTKYEYGSVEMHELGEGRHDFQ